MPSKERREKNEIARASKRDLDDISKSFREKLTPRKRNTIFKALYAKAERGSLKAIQLLLDRTFGKAKESLEVTTNQADYAALPEAQLHALMEKGLAERGWKLTRAEAVEAEFKILPPPETKLAGLTQELEHALATGTIGPDAVPAPQVLHDPVRPDAEPSPDHAPDRTGESDGAARGGAGDGGAVPASSVRGIAQDAGPEQSAGVAGPEDEDPSTLLDDCEEEIAPEGTAGVQRGSTGSLDMGGGDPSEPAV